MGSYDFLVSLRNKVVLSYWDIFTNNKAQREPLNQTRVQDAVRKRLENNVKIYIPPNLLKLEWGRDDKEVLLLSRLEEYVL